MIDRVRESTRTHLCVFDSADMAMSTTKSAATSTQVWRLYQNIRLHWFGGKQHSQYCILNQSFSPARSVVAWKLHGGVDHNRVAFEYASSWRNVLTLINNLFKLGQRVRGLGSRMLVINVKIFVDPRDAYAQPRDSACYPSNVQAPSLCRSPPKASIGQKLATKSPQAKIDKEYM